MNFNGISPRYTMMMLIMILNFVIHSVFSLDCPSSGKIACQCSATTVDCSGIQTNVSEIQDILEKVSSMQTVILKIPDLRLDSDFKFENTTIRNLTLGYGLQNTSSDLLSGLGSSLISLNLQNNSIKNIDNQLFSSLHGLTELFLDENEIYNLTSSMFASLINLNYLSITNNDVHEVNSDVFKNLSALQTLILSHNSIYQVENLGIISSSLTELKADNCLIEGSLDKHTFSDIPNLEQLDMSHNKLSEVKSHSLSSLKNLRLLNLSFNIIEHLQENAFFEMTNLTYLDLRGNAISVVRLTSFANLKNLKFLDLSGNKLNAILCDYTTDFSSLERIYLRYNIIKMFTPGSFFYSPKLKVLDLTGNNLECSCPLTDTANYLIENSTMKREDLESVLCLTSSKLSVSITAYNSSKCTPQDSCKKPDYANTESSDDYGDYDYSDEITTSMSTFNNTINTIIDTTLTTEKVSSTEITTMLIINANTASVKYTENSTLFTLNNTNESESSTMPISTSFVSDSNTDDYTNITFSDVTRFTILRTLSPLTTIITTPFQTNTDTASGDSFETSSVAASSLAPKSSCSSLNLYVDDSSSDSELKVFKNFSYDGKTLCLKWAIGGYLNATKCVIKYTLEKGTTKFDYVTCPSAVNEIKEWSKEEKIRHFCIEIFIPNKKKFCFKTTEKTTTISSPLLTTPFVTYSQSPMETDTSTETTTNSTFASSVSYISTTLEGFTTIPSSKVSDTEDVSLSTGTIHIVQFENTTDKRTSSKTDAVITTVKSVTNPSTFVITALTVYFNNSNLAFVTWAVNMEVPFHKCNITLTATTQNFDHDEGIFPCKNNSHRLRSVNVNEIFKICLVSYHETSGKDVECRLSLSPALESKSKEEKEDSLNSSWIPLICLLVLLVIIIIFIIYKNVFKKKHVANKYDVRAEEVKYQQRVDIRPRSSNDQSIRFSYISKESHDTI